MGDPQSEVPVEQLVAYHRKERESLETFVDEGTLKRVLALNGKMYVLSLTTGEFPIAISVNNLIIRNGDEVELERKDPSGTMVKVKAPISEFQINPGNHEIEFSHRGLKIPSILRAQDVVANHSAVTRCFK